MAAYSHPFARAAHRYGFASMLRSRTALAVSLALCLLAMCVVTPATAYAGTYSLPHVHIMAQVADNGDLLVTEERAFAFEDDVNGVFWSIPLSHNQQGLASEVTVFDVSAHDGSTEAGSDAGLQARPMTEVDAANPGDRDVYTVENDGTSLKLKVFMPHEYGDESIVRVSYAIKGAVMSWPDTAELYWQFIGPEWEEDSQDVQLTLSFPGIATGTPALVDGPDANLRAWGHGPLDGSVELDAEGPDGPQVIYRAPSVRAGQFAEARVAFPADWAPALEPAGDSRLDAILSEEMRWADEANAQREHARSIVFVGTIALTALPAALLIAAIWLRKVKYANPAPTFKDTYFRDVPSSDHPAVLSALVHGGEVRDCAFVATLMRLTDDHVIEIVRRTRTESRFLGLGEKEVEEYSLKLIARERTDDRIDCAALNLYFGPDARNGAEVGFDELKEGENAGECMSAFKDCVLAELEVRSLTNLAPAWPALAVGVIAGLLVFGAIGFMVYTDAANMPLVLVGMGLSIAAAVVVLTMERHSHEAVELLARCNALKRWLEDFTNLDEAVPDDLILWNKILVLAAAFGVSDEVLRQLADAVPEDRRFDENGAYRYPSYWWYYSHGSLGAPMTKMHEAYRATVGELASSLNSSGAGGGGGFSFGGGGGVGGGGGGTF